MIVMDIRDVLPRVPANDPRPVSGWAKTTITVHYQGMDVRRDLTDADARGVIQGDAYEHIARDWNNEFPGVQGGGGVMYHEMIAPSGTVFLTRNHDEWLWHCGDDNGNKHSIAIQVMCGPNTPPTAAQYQALAERITANNLSLPTLVVPHRSWSATSCPGQALVDWIATPRPITGDEVDVTPEQEAKIDRILAHLDAFEALVWVARTQRGLDVETGKPLDAAVPPRDARIRT